jgi:flagellar hook-length control protein FliK
MTPSASASPIVLLAPAAAPAGVSASAENAPAPALDGGFQLLVDVAAQQQLAAQLAGSAPKPQTAATGEGGEAAAEAGNVLPLPGLILPIDDGQPVVAEHAGKKTEGADDGDAALPATPSTTTIPVPWVPINIQAQSPQPVAKGAGTHATADTDATIDAAVDAGATAATAALAAASAAAQPAANSGDATATTAPADDGIQLGAGMAVAGTAPRQAGAERTAQPAFDALAGSSVDGAKGVPTGAGPDAGKSGDVASFADALKPAVTAAAAATDSAQPAASTVGMVDASRGHAPTRSYLDINNATTGATVAVPVGSSGWSDAVVDKVMWFSANQINSAEIKLNPPDLGPLHVRISTQQDQTTSVVFSSPHAAVRDALDQALPRLRDMFGGQGLQLSDASVGGQAQRQQQQGGEQPSGRGSAQSNWFGGDDSGDTPVAVTRVVGPRLSTAAVDAYA